MLFLKEFFKGRHRHWGFCVRVISWFLFYFTFGWRGLALWVIIDMGGVLLRGKWILLTGQRYILLGVGDMYCWTGRGFGGFWEEVRNLVISADISSNFLCFSISSMRRISPKFFLPSSTRNSLIQRVPWVRKAELTAESISKEAQAQDDRGVILLRSETENCSTAAQSIVIFMVLSRSSLVSNPLTKNKPEPFKSLTSPKSRHSSHSSIPPSSREKLGKGA